MARPTKLTAEIIEKVRGLIVLGLTYKLVAQNIGVSEETFRKWRKEGNEIIEAKKRFETPYESLLKELVLTVQKANSEAVSRRLARLDKGAQEGKHQIDMWFLERRFPDEFGTKQIVKVGNENDEPLKVKLQWPDQK
jgi:transposase-like protein